MCMTDLVETLIFIFYKKHFNKRALGRSPDSDFIWPFLPPYMGVIPNPKFMYFST